jgi:hypothetical protein
VFDRNGAAVSLYLALIEVLGQADILNVNCAACHHVLGAARAETPRPRWSI